MFRVLFIFSGTIKRRKTGTILRILERKRVVYCSNRKQEALGKAKRKISQSITEVVGT